jgi:chemotaxis protein MotB
MAETEKPSCSNCSTRGSGVPQDSDEARAGTLSGELAQQRDRQCAVPSIRSSCSTSRSQHCSEPDRRSRGSAAGIENRKDKQSQTKIADLGRRLNVALAQRVQELNRYRSDFFGRLREILSDRENIRIVGDRFVFQSEVLFPSGGADLNRGRYRRDDKLASAIIDLSKEIPAEIDWVLRVDGHTDNVPLSGAGKYADNWELSSGRATSVVKYLISKGVPANRLVAAGFGQYQPIAEGDSDEARATESPYRTEADRAVNRRSVLMENRRNQHGGDHRQGDLPEIATLAQSRQTDRPDEVQDHQNDRQYRNDFRQNSKSLTILPHNRHDYSIGWSSCRWGIVGKVL